ncbi:hypothetical protein OHA72_12280 [Dactylosporangium sp. NBC_01737]|uniref:hypothetical protein n=1 Tax=Dactylosporangium sp. NBC_01737 TaxID=2975959 RepID=UPI002E0ECCC4|nr:hypothetical protein OHA72_12280 [Dactylosporangium sp. NBC_01737]
MLSRMLITITLVVAALAVPVSAASAAPPGARATTTTETQAAVAVEPTMYPPADKVLWSTIGVRGQRCETGTLCVDVWDPTRNMFKVFIMRTCNTRAVHDFHQYDKLTEFINHQTPGTVTRFLGRPGNVLVKSTAPSYTMPIIWDKVWYIDVC